MLLPLVIDKDGGLYPYVTMIIRPLSEGNHYSEVILMLYMIKTLASYKRHY
jgi:hypothetical protein